MNLPRKVYPQGENGPAYYVAKDIDAMLAPTPPSPALVDGLRLSAKDAEAFAAVDDTIRFLLDHEICDTESIELAHTHLKKRMTLLLDTLARLAGENERWLQGEAKRAEVVKEYMDRAKYAEAELALLRSQITEAAK